ncbi:hypothetical protein ACQEVG_30800 [Streptomyces sp. CA-135486]|uniref:hypothetical protein n=1 Tax=Streptomyces sp. CA-135486 TaxID=3240049 RepID=UPI003D8B0688
MPYTALSTTVATIAATTLTGIAFGAIEGITIDLAVAQPLKVATGLQDGFSLDSVEQAGVYGGIFAVASEVRQECPVLREKSAGSVISSWGRTFP